MWKLCSNATSNVLVYSTKGQASLVIETEAEKRQSRKTRQKNKVEKH